MIIKFDTGNDVIYIAISCANLERKVNVVCFYIPPSVNEQYIWEHFENLLEGYCQMSNCFLGGEKNYLKHLRLVKSIKPFEIERVLSRYKIIIVHKVCRNNLEFGVIKTNITHLYAIFVQ